MESHTCDNKKNPEKDSIFKQGQIMTLAAASVISGHVHSPENPQAM
jgi:hypothetical protein